MLFIEGNGPFRADNGADAAAFTEVGITGDDAVYHLEGVEGAGIDTGAAGYAYFVIYRD